MKLQDYLHYYIYSGIGVYVFPDDTITNGFLAKYKQDYPNGVYNPVLTLDNYVKFLNDGYKPILRRLEDMTEEERDEVFGADTHWYKPFDATDACDSKQWHKLLSMGFDLFGLIDAGLAVDGKKM